MEQKPDHHQIAQSAIEKSDSLHECIRLIRILVFARIGDQCRAHYNAIVLARENGGAIKFPGLRKLGENDWTKADLSGIVL